MNATGRVQSHPMQKLLSALRMLRYGEATDRSDEYVRLSSSTAEIAVKKLATFLVEEYGPIYLRPSNDAELDTMQKRNAERGLPDCI